MHSTNMLLDDIVIEKRHRTTLRNIEILAQSITDVGLLQPIVIRPDKRLVAGERRIAACQSLGWAKIPVVIAENLEDELMLLRAEQAENTQREDFLPSEAVALGKEIEDQIQAEAKERQLANLKQGDQAPVVQNLPNGAKGKTRDQMGEIVGMSGWTYEKAKQVVEAAEENPDEFDDLVPLMDERGIDPAHKELRKRKKQSSQPKPAITENSAHSPRLIVSRAENMPQLADESIDLIITSPPYNLGSNDWPMGGDGRTPRDEGIGYTDDMEEKEYQAWQMQCLREMYRVAKQGASLFYNHKPRTKHGVLIHPLEWLKDSPWILRQEIIWDRGSTHNHGPTLFWPEDERIYWMTKGSPMLPNRPVGMSTVWRFHGPVAGTWHPAPFPPELPKRCIEAIGRDGITVLDPFAGGCTTLKVALDYGYDAIGVDISHEYLDKARKENGWTMPSEP